MIASVGVRRYLATLLYEVKPNDPAILCGAALVLILVATIANYIPARRAARTNPVTALRTE
ncbi:MAG: hypothetical protein ABI442_03120 [Gemmatimonadaceae bacterium]